MWLNKAAEPIDIHEFARLSMIPDYKRIGLDYIGEWEISTVWLGIDHRFYGGGPPIIFETMVFHPETGMDEHYCDRYCTEEEAVRGHAQIVEMIRIVEDAAMTEGSECDE